MREKALKARRALLAHHIVSADAIRCLTCRRLPLRERGH